VIKVEIPAIRVMRVEWTDAVNQALVLNAAGMLREPEGTTPHTRLNNVYRSESRRILTSVVSHTYL
jgi:hypothetical protein